jgi:phosphoglycerate dehydrogenase-like enzyme
MIPSQENLTICFAHAAYQMQTSFDALGTGIAGFQVRTRDELDRRVHEADVVVVSGMWHNGLIPHANRLRFIQSISAGIDQYDCPALSARGVRLASAQGVNARAVSEHAMALILAMIRRLPEARDNQAKRVWRGMIGDLTLREDELGGKTLVIIGLGRIGGRLAQLAKAFDMKVIGVRRDATAGHNNADSVHTLSELPALLPQADFVALTCPLTPETKGVIDAAALGLMKPSAVLVNVGRGLCVVESDLITALADGRIAGAALDCTAEEPLPAASPLWAMANVLVTPHTAGETRRYEANVLEILMENLERLWRGETALRNQII